MATTAPTVIQPELAQQSAKLMGHYAGYLGTWTIELGLRAGLLEELASERRWEELFAGSHDLLGHLADEALAEHRAGRTEELNPEKL